MRNPFTKTAGPRRESTRWIGLQRCAYAAVTGRKSGFTLTELLVVIAVIGLMSSLVVPAVTSLATGDNFNQSLIQISGAFEKAHEYAIANNTYTYVGFTQSSNGQVFMGIFASTDGTPGGVSSLSGTSILTVTSQALSGSLILLEPISQLKGIAMQDAVPAGNQLLNNPAVSGTSSLPLMNGASGPEFTYSSPAYGALAFTRSIQFTASGEGRVSPSLSDSVLTVITPVAGNSATPLQNSNGASAIVVTGLSGQVTVYRPGVQ